MAQDVQISDKLLKIFRLEKAIMDMPQAELKVEHQFCNGLYARTMHIPPNCLLSGAIHKDESFFLVREGYIAVTTDKEEILAGPGFMSVTPPSAKRMGLSFTSCVVTTFHPNPTNEKNEDKIWDMYTIPEPIGILEMIQRLEIGGEQ